MKNVFKLSLVVLLLIAVISCKKKAGEPVVIPQINGIWELRHIEGIQVANADPNFKPGNGNLLKFEQSNFKSYVDGKMTNNGTYVIKEEKNSVNGKTTNYSLLLNDKDKYYLNLSGNKLVLFIGSIPADGVESTYERQN